MEEKQKKERKNGKTMRNAFHTDCFSSPAR